jgi:hypothetical protein
MKLRWLLFLLLIAVVFAVLKPGSTWQELKRSWARREWIVTVLLVAVLGYMAWGLYNAVSSGVLSIGFSPARG